jgi:hypothetical protein
MAARLSGRVRSLERSAGLRGTCPECDGRGTPTLEFWIDGERQGPAPRGCPRCGRRGLLYRVGLDDPHDGGGALGSRGEAAP